MSLDFTETLTIEVPDVEEQVAAFKESDYQKTHGLIVEVAAIHEGMTSNFNFYPAEALEASLESWVSPYPKPIIMNHDPSSEPVGRVMGAKMEKEADDTPYVLLQVAITDPEAIRKVVDQRYLTGSVGGSAKQANCSVCGVDWAEASPRNIPCKHSRGKTYKGKLCYMEMNGIGFKEYSFVNMPADQRSSVRSLRTQEGEEPTESDGWVRAAKVFSLNMDDQEIMEFSESSKDTNVLENMKKKDATPIYMQLKGAFLSAMAVSESEAEENDEELDVTKDIINEEEEDVLAVADDLSSDLAESHEGEEEVTSEDVEEEEVADEVTDSTDEEESEESDSEEEVVEASEEEEVEEADDKPEGQESPQSQDIDPEDSSGAPVSREDDEEEEVVNEEESTETDLNETVSTLESRVEELESREQTLLEENAKLKTALKRSLAERVVDTKIALNFMKTEEREEQLEEHAQRSASSLADTLRDLAGMSRISSGAPPQMVNDESASISEDDNSVIVADVNDEPEEEEDKVDPESVFVDALMGRRKL